MFLINAELKGSTMCMHAKNELSFRVFLFVSGTLHVCKHLSLNVVKAGPTFYLGSCRIIFFLAVVRRSSTLRSWCTYSYDRIQGYDISSSGVRFASGRCKFHVCELFIWRKWCVWRRTREKNIKQRNGTQYDTGCANLLGLICSSTNGSSKATWLSRMLPTWKVLCVWLFL